jgi:hypothetical protein
MLIFTDFNSTAQVEYLPQPFPIVKKILFVDKIILPVYMMKFVYPFDVIAEYIKMF